MMTPQETQALQEFLSQLTQVQGITKDPQASSMIAAAFARQPDAGYLLVQRTMLQDQALATARAQINQLQAQLQAEREARGGAAGGSFLDPASAWGNSASDGGRTGGFGAGAGRMAPPPVPARYQQPQAMAPQYADPQAGQYAPPQRPGFFGGGGGSSFLGNMAATAAGVAGGAFLFQGIESLMGHHGSGANGLMGQNGGLPTENTTVNNFYGSENEGGQERLLSDGSGAGGDNFLGSDDIAGNDISGSDDFGSSDDMSSI